MQFASLVPELAGAASEGSSGSALAGCERDCAKLAGRALLLLQQVPILGDLLSHYMSTCTLPRASKVPSHL